MNPELNERKLREILCSIDFLRGEVEALLPPPKPVPVPVPVPVPAADPPKPAAAPSCAGEPSAFGTFLDKVGDWVCVRGAFAPSGVTREFAVATRWLVRTGSVILVGAIAYFLMLAIDRGWIGPVQRTYGMMAWGVLGTALGARMKAREGRYALLGEVCAALGLAGLYLSFGFGYRYFSPPVIGPAAAFAGLVSATLAAGVLSVRLRSLAIALLALAGGFLVPSLVSFGTHVGQLEAYLVLLAGGGTAIAYCRRWTPLGFAAIAVATVFRLEYPTAHVLSEFSPMGFVSGQLALALALTAFGAARRLRGSNGFCWAFSALVMALWGRYALEEAMANGGWWIAALGAGALSVLAWGVRRRGWAAGTGVSVLLAFAVLYADVALGFGMGRTCWGSDWLMLSFCAFAALLAELGVRTRERALRVQSLVTSAVLVFVFAGVLCEVYGHGNFLYGLGDRVRLAWCAPIAIGYVVFRLAGPGRTLERSRGLWLVPALMALAVLSCESRVFGDCYCPSLGHGILTIVWAVTASALLAGGIVGRRRVFRLSGLALLAVALWKLLSFDTASLAMPSRVAVFASVGGLLLAGAFLYLRFKARFGTPEKGVD